MKWTTWVSLLGLGGIIAVVVYTSFDVGAVRCEICITFQGREACRAVDGATEAEARQAAVTNACALISSGVTDTMACSRVTPSRDHCEAAPQSPK
jgi:hypothetical protein